MANFQVNFYDENLGEQSADFDKIWDAIDYWNEYADVSSCLAGQMIDLRDNEVMVEFDVRK